MVLIVKGNASMDCLKEEICIVRLLSIGILAAGISSSPEEICSLINPLSGNVCSDMAYIIILPCLMPDNFTRQAESVATQ